MVSELRPRVASLDQRVTRRVVHSDSWRGLKTTGERGYTYAWQKARAAFLVRYPLCAQCERMGRTTVATVVDHVTPHRGDRALFWDSGNWQSLCASCHSGWKQREERKANACP